jgi:hypothetical protein
MLEVTAYGLSLFIRVSQHPVFQGYPQSFLQLKQFWRSVNDGIPTDVVAIQLQMTSASVRQSRSRILRRLRVIMGDAL